MGCLSCMNLYGFAVPRCWWTFLYSFNMDDQFPASLAEPIVLEDCPYASSH
jgi:hypothetical protein